MTAPASTNNNLIRFEESVEEVDLVATVKFKPDHFIESNQLDFISSYDDLDLLIFACVCLPSGNRVALVRHQNAPYFGTEVYLAPHLSSPSSVLAEAFDVLNIFDEDLEWIRKDIDLSVRQST